MTGKTTNPQQPTITWLLDALEQAFHRRSWHGTNLRGSLRGLSADEAVWRPTLKRHCIADHVLHAAYWKYSVRRRLLGEKRGSFPIKGSDWLPLPEPWNPAAWKRCVQILESEHAALRAAIETLRDADLPQPAGGTGKETAGFLITGVTAHDLYHTGQVQLLKRLQR
jgi:uncharacterized damage-inducible protein DinB